MLSTGWREHGSSPTVGMALRELWPQSEDTEVTLPHFFPGTMSVQAVPLPSALPLPNTPCSPGWPQIEFEPAPAGMSSQLCRPSAPYPFGPCLGLWFVLELGFRLEIMKRTYGKSLRKMHPPLPGLISPLNTVFPQTMKEFPELPLIPSGWREEGWGRCDSWHPRDPAFSGVPPCPSQHLPDPPALQALG